ncbi:MAG: hypothetical protein LBS22_02645 [Puniceicoccales bacterium]|jgi:hypothetical protein|nr:hypothetical protein [Puniceicoccales bacterium]
MEALKVLADASGATDTAGEDSGIKSVDLKVTRFISIMCGEKANARQLRVRSVTLTDPQRSARPSTPAAAPATDAGSAASTAPAGSAVPAESVAPAPIHERLELDDLAKAIEQGESKINLWDRFVAKVISWLPGRDASTEVAKRAFRRINETNRSGLLKLAFQAVALSENSRDVPTNVQNLLKFCRAEDVDVDIIIDSIDSVPNPDGKAKVLKELGSPISGFNWRNLKPTAAKKAVLALAKAGKANWGDCTSCLCQLLEDNKLVNLPKLEDGEASELVLELAKSRGHRKSLVLLLKNDKLGNLKIDTTTNKSLILELVKLGANGTNCLEELIKNGKLPDLKIEGDTGKSLILKLAGLGQDGVKCLKELLKNAKAGSLDLDAATAKAFVLELAELGTSGADCLEELIRNGQLPNLKIEDADANQFAQSLVEVAAGSVLCLMKLIENGQLPNLKIEGADARTFILKLASANKGTGYGVPCGVPCLTKLLENGQLSDLKIEGADARTFILELASLEGIKAKYLGELLKNAKVGSLGLDAATAKAFVLELAKLEASGVDCLWRLFLEGKLDSLDLKDTDVARTFALTLVKVQDEEVAKQGIVYLNRLLEEKKLGSLNLDAATAKTFIPDLIRATEDSTDAYGISDGTDCVWRLLQEGNSLPIFEATDAKELVVSLANAGWLAGADDAHKSKSNAHKSSAHCVWELARHNRLGNLANLKSTEIEEFVEELREEYGESGRECVEQICRHVENWN